jgi:carboxypeptidase C (cathepsin A)
MELNPYMKVRISHGIYDLVTPYFSAERLVANMKLDQASRSRLSLKHYPGGHMFYSRDQSRRDFTSDIRAFYTEALATRSETR